VPLRATRVSIDLEDTCNHFGAHRESASASFFDLHAARLTPEASRANIPVDVGLLTAVSCGAESDSVVRGAGT